MRKVIWLAVLFVVAATAGVLSQDQSGLEADRAAVKAAALDYMDGALDGDAARIERAIHPELTKISVQTFPQTGTQFLSKSGYSRLIELVRADVVHLEEAERDIKVTIYAIEENLAAVKVTSTIFYDYLLMAKIDGQWKLINVLWTYNPGWEKNPNQASGADQPAADPAADEAAVKQACLDYLEGYFSGDASRMDRALHPELTKVRPQALKQTGKIMLDKVGAELLVEATRTKMGMLDEAERKIQYRLLDHEGNIAMAEAISSMFYDYVQLVKMNGEWKIINVLWAMNPEAPVFKKK